MRALPIISARIVRYCCIRYAGLKEEIVSVSLKGGIRWLAKGSMDRRFIALVNWLLLQLPLRGRA